MIELLAGVPSVVYGFCGLFFLPPGETRGDWAWPTGWGYSLPRRSFDHDHPLFASIGRG
jgi:hypothetical protein